MEIKKRWTAFKLPIGALLKAKLEFENERFKFALIDDKEIVRVNIVANVIDKYETENYSTLTLDDGTGTIRLKAFSDSVALLNNIEIAATVVVIGVLRYFNNELYIVPEIVKEVDPKLLLARKLELLEKFKELYEKSEETRNETRSESEKVDEIEKEREPTLKEQILEMVREAEVFGGITLEELVTKLNKPLDTIKEAVTELLEQGFIFEPKPGKLRIL
ncbi:MAG TPA: hypothetical protein ENF67_00605 [Candidatus Pacearchaeota archaeon]|nr:hypothetical protein [Candidatus Pacearchaeota archaeon]